MARWRSRTTRRRARDRRRARARWPRHRIAPGAACLKIDGSPVADVQHRLLAVVAAQCPSHERDVERGFLLVVRDAEGEWSSATVFHPVGSNTGGMSVGIARRRAERQHAAALCERGQRRAGCSGPQRSQDPAAGDCPIVVAAHAVRLHGGGVYYGALLRSPGAGAFFVSLNRSVVSQQTSSPADRVSMCAARTGFPERIRQILRVRHPR